MQDDNENTNSWRAFAALGQFLLDDDWHPQQVEEKTIYRIYFSGQNGEQRCYAQIRIDLEQFLFYSVAPVKAPEEKRAAMAEFVTRANYGLRIGNFEMDYRDGEIRYKSSLDFEGEDLSPALIKNAIYPAVRTMDFYLPGIMQVLYGNESAAEVIAEIESNI
ncbi:MAG: YbjN domain-containing protein [Anaerolineales bacterium]